MRAVCASLAVLLFLGGVAGLVAAPNALYIGALIGAAVLALPAMFGGRKPTPRDLTRINEQLQRFRIAMLLCFTAASGVYALVLTQTRRAPFDVLRRLAGLGVALWLVAFVLMFFVAYYRTQRRLAAED